MNPAFSSVKSGTAALLCVMVGLALAGCAADDRAWVKYRSQARLTEHRQQERELTTRRRTTDRLLAAYRGCLAAGGTRDACWRDLLLYRTCLEAGGSDMQCRGRP